MKLNPAERHLYTILAERAEMTLDEWIQSLPRQQLAQLEAEDPEDYQSLMMDFAKQMLAGGADSPNLSANREANWHTCPACGEKKYASAYPGDSKVCRMCTHKREESEPKALSDPEEAKKPDPNDPRYKTCDRCGKRKYMTKFSPKSSACKLCQKEEADAQAEPEPEIIESPPIEQPQEEHEVAYRPCERCGKNKAKSQFVPGMDICKECKQEVDNQTNQRVSRRQCMMCKKNRPVRMFRHALARMCDDCTSIAEEPLVAKENA